MLVKTITKEKLTFLPSNVSVAVFPVTTKSCALLDKLEKQEMIGKERKPRVKISNRMKKLEKAYSDFLVQVKRIGSGIVTYIGGDEAYPIALAIAKKIKYSPSDVDLFVSVSLPALMKTAMKDQASQIMSDWCAQYTGQFISALINSSPDSDFTLHIDAVPQPIGFLCYMNVKNVIVFGDVNDSFAYCMEGGNIRVEGNAELINNDIQGGKLSVNGKIAGVSDRINHGNVFQYDRQLVKDGKIISQPENK